MGGTGRECGDDVQSELLVNGAGKVGRDCERRRR